jgi:hypothetical protein
VQNVNASVRKVSFGGPKKRKLRTNPGLKLWKNRLGMVKRTGTVKSLVLDKND